MSGHPSEELSADYQLQSGGYFHYARSPLPTRVSSACERCRRHKTRCDPFRPCSLCARAKVDCQPLPASQTRRDSTRKAKRILRSHERQRTASAAAADQPSEGFEATSKEAPPAGASNHDSRIATDSRVTQPAVDYGEAESTMGIVQKICELGRQHIDEQATSAIPGYRASTSVAKRRTAALGQRLPISSILGQDLPPTEIMYSLLEDYFDAVHWFSLAIYEPTFRRKLLSVADGFAYPSQKSFLLLLAVVLGMGAWYRSQRRTTDSTDNGDWQQLSANLLKIVESHVVELMDQPSVTAAQICILFGSHHVYHGRPNLSFSLLGATIKISQAAGLHRELPRGNFEDIEERKRVWWTIYTWDRFASITYGRPLGINDKDCNLNMPADTFENPYFVAPRSEQGYTVCYSTYQRELNRLYLMASTALEAIFGSRTSGSSEELAGDAYVALVKEATQNLRRWRDELPEHLVLDLERDFPPDSGLSARAHALQSLSLQLTYDNILIVLHRPLLARQVDHLSTNRHAASRSGGMDSPSCHPSGPSPPQRDPAFDAVSPNASVTSPVHWWNAALRTSRVTELPVLAQLATDSHLVAFLAINLFNAAIVLAVMALSDPLSDTAQVVKRTITRILRLQDLLGKRSALSKQSTTVLKNVVTLLLRRESEAILAPITTNNQQEGHQSLVDSAPMSVEDTLRLPLDATLDFFDAPTRRPAWPDQSRAQRLNESLASVQFVVPSGNDDRSFNWYASGDTHQARGTIQDTIQPDNTWQQSAPNEWHDHSVSLGSMETASYGTSERGLYWLWDMSWNGTES
ncbi:Zn(II)2Cys6 transcription factor [Aspergillus fumigatus Af293]|uniref:C6 transcription factor, putative n=1 Tax=Aspergillus fumigatus (strain ATCC MYA-4609 / CBS 101355 / FGSC A1100 / Af293) TaxID=330879 RepID=Q4WBE3_ASPFU|nr:C6 transcription factor, putative [Aspergillus fumigatus Af293]EAL84969.1 C6 transcription factor, putative [Aspergillus fumigatus Af293]